MPICGNSKRAGLALAAGLSALAVSGCGSTSSGQVVAARPVANLVGNSTSTGDSSSAVQAQLNADIAAANSTMSVKGTNASGKVTFPSDLTLMQIERLSALQKLGDTEATKRLAAIGTLRGVVAANHTISASQQGGLLAQLDSASNGLAALRSKIDADTLVDVTRTDVRNINLLFHVEGLLDPKVHLEAAAYELQAAAGQFTRELAALTQAYNTALGRPTTGLTGDPASLFADLQVRINSIQAAARSALSVLPTLQAVDYPANKGTLDDQHRAILAARTEVATAATDVSGIRAMLP